jgi:hypothetical protein
MDEFRVDPKLINKIKSVHYREHPRRETEQHDRRVKDPMRDSAEPALPDGDAQVVMLAGMMDNVKIPKDTRFVTEAVKPVIGKIIDEKERHPAPPHIGRELVRSDLIKKDVYQPCNKSKQKVENDAPESKPDICPGVAFVIEFIRAFPPRKQRLKRDH